MTNLAKGDEMRKWVFSLFGLLIASSIGLYIWADSVINEGHEPKADGTNIYAIVLGARVKENGEPSLTLLYRLNETFQYLETYPHVKVIVSGGQGEDEPISEADFMYEYLVREGIDERRIIIENQSTSTYENLLYSKERLPKEVTKVTIISSDFHLARAKMIANELNLEADVVAAKTPKIVEKKLRMREKLALIKTLLLGK